VRVGAAVCAGAAIIAALAGIGSVGLALPAPDAARERRVDDAASGPLVTVDGQGVTVDARDAELSDVLSRLAQRVGFRLSITGRLGLVTAAFTRASVEEALQQLVRDHDLMLVYRAPAGTDERPRLLQVDVFAGTPRWGVGLTGAARTTVLAEIAQLVAAPDREYAIRRLTQLIGAVDPAIRARTAWALGRLGGPQAALSLAAATRDQSPDVRAQAAYALGNAQAARAIPALGDLLLHDPDVRVRRAAARMLGSIPDAAATSVLTAAAQDHDAWVRRDVAAALRRHGVVVAP